MTKVTGIRLALDKYESKKKEMRKEYNERSAEAITPDEISEVNYWHVQKAGELENEFIKEIFRIFGAEGDLNG